MEEKSAAEDRLRGKAGQFISEEKAKDLTPEDLPDLISSSQKVTGALKDLKEEKENAEDVNKPLVKFEVNNPISWFMAWLKSLKKRQTTTVSIRFGIPLIAIPVIAAAIGALFFGLGRLSSTTTSPTPQPSLSPCPTVMNQKISKIGQVKIMGEKAYLVVSRSEIISLNLPQEVDITGLAGKRVLVTGEFDKSANQIDISASGAIEVLPDIIKTPQAKTPTSTPIPTPTPSAAPVLVPVGE